MKLITFATIAIIAIYILVKLDDHFNGHHHFTKRDLEVVNENGTYWPQPQAAENNRHQSGL